MNRGILLAALVAAFGLAGCGEGAPAEPGEQVYNRYCFSCHAAGIAGAPRVGDMAAWGPRIAKGPEALLQSTIAGIAPGMPAMGLCTTCSEEDLAAAIDYMIVKTVAESQ